MCRPRSSAREAAGPGPPAVHRLKQGRLEALARGNRLRPLLDLHRLESRRGIEAARARRRFDRREQPGGGIRCFGTTAIGRVSRLSPFRRIQSACGSKLRRGRPGPLDLPHQAWIARRRLTLPCGRLEAARHKVMPAPLRLPARGRPTANDQPVAGTRHGHVEKAAVLLLCRGAKALDRLAMPCSAFGRRRQPDQSRTPSLAARHLHEGFVVLGGRCRSTAVDKHHKWCL